MTGGPKAERVRRVTSASDGPVEVGWVPEHSAPTVKDRPLVMLQTLSQRDGRPLFRLTFDEAEAWELHASLGYVLGAELMGLSIWRNAILHAIAAVERDYPDKRVTDPFVERIRGLIDEGVGERAMNVVDTSGYTFDTSIPAAGGGGGGAGQPTGGTGTSGRPWPCAHPVTLDRKEYGVLVKRTCGVCGEVLAGSGGFGGSVGHRCTDNRNEPCTPDHCQAEEFCPARAPRESVKVGGNCQGVLSCSGEGCAWPGHESTIDQLRRENVRLDDKWRDYEENYILPCFAWARDAGIDLPTLVSEAKGNCVERLVQTLRAQRDEARKRLVQTLRAQGDQARTKLAAEPTWDDRPDEWTEAVKAAFPTRSGSHDEYALAMKMVGSRKGKGELVALVNWLLVRLSRATGTSFRRMATVSLTTGAMNTKMLGSWQRDSATSGVRWRRRLPHGELLAYEDGRWEVRDDTLNGSTGAMGKATTLAEAMSQAAWAYDSANSVPFNLVEGGGEGGASCAPVKEDVKGEVGSGRSDECLRCGAPLGVLGTYCTDDAACREREALIRKACNLPPR